jgi:hypothetical protein
LTEIGIVCSVEGFVVLASKLPTGGLSDLPGAAGAIPAIGFVVTGDLAHSPRCSWRPARCRASTERPTAGRSWYVDATPRPTRTPGRDRLEPACAERRDAAGAFCRGRLSRSIRSAIETPAPARGVEIYFVNLPSSCSRPKSARPADPRDRQLVGVSRRRPRRSGWPPRVLLALVLTSCAGASMVT